MVMEAVREEREEELRFADVGLPASTYLPQARIQPLYGYYRQPNGWITVAITTQIEEVKYRAEGWEPLVQYGRFDMSNKYTVDNPLEWLFQQGGAKELDEEQIRQQGLYLRPKRMPRYGWPLIPTCRQPITQYHKNHHTDCWRGAKPVEFPQLEHMDGLGPFPCSYCDRQNLPTPQARDQHMSVAHKKELDNIEMGKALAEALVGGLQRSGVSVAAKEASPNDLALEAVRLLAGAGLTKRQREALNAAGIDMPEMPDGG